MGLRIATNIPAIAAQRTLGITHDNLNRSLEKLSSGSRINRAGDDAAGLAISDFVRFTGVSSAREHRIAHHIFSIDAYRIPFLQYS
jgi:hypothetical protein